MKLTLLPYERDLLEYLEYMDKQFGVERPLLMGFATTLDCLRRLFQDLMTGMRDEMRAGHVVVIGLSNYTHYLLGGGLQALVSTEGVTRVATLLRSEEV